VIEFGFQQDASPSPLRLSRLAVCVAKLVAWVVRSDRFAVN